MIGNGCWWMSTEIERERKRPWVQFQSYQASSSSAQETLTWFPWLSSRSPGGSDVSGAQVARLFASNQTQESPALVSTFSQHPIHRSHTQLLSPDTLPPFVLNQPPRGPYIWSRHILQSSLWSLLSLAPQETGRLKMKNWQYCETINLLANVAYFKQK